MYVSTYVGRIYRVSVDIDFGCPFLRVVDVIVVDPVVDRVLKLHGDVAPAGELVVVDLGPVVALDQDADGCVDAVAAVIPVVFDALVGILGRTLASVGADDSKPFEGSEN